MKHLLIYANEAHAQVALFDVSTGIVKEIPVINTNDSADIEAFNLLKAILSVKKDESFNIIANRELTLPVLESMKIWKILAREEFDAQNPTEVADYNKYLQRAEGAGIDTDQVDKENIQQLKNLALASMTNTWSDRNVIDFMLLLALAGKHKFRNFDTLLEELPEGKKIGDVETVLRSVAAKIHDNCKLPEVKFVKTEMGGM